MAQDKDWPTDQPLPSQYKDRPADQAPTSDLPLITTQDRTTGPKHPRKVFSDDTGRQSWTL